MTSGVTEGFPDWTRNYGGTVQLVAFEIFNSAAINPEQFGPFFVGSFSTLRFLSRYVGGAPGPVIERMTVDFLWDTQPSSSIGDAGIFSYYGQLNDIISDAFSVMAGYLTIQCTNLELAPTNLWKLQLIGSGGDVISTRPALGKTLVSVPEVTIAGGAEYQPPLAYVTTGPCAVTAVGTGPAWECSIIGLNADGSITALADVNGDATTVTEPFLINLPASTIQVSLTNNDVADRVFNLAMIIP